MSRSYEKLPRKRKEPMFFQVKRDSKELVIIYLVKTFIIGKFKFRYHRKGYVALLLGKLLSFIKKQHDS